MTAVFEFQRVRFTDLKSNPKPIILQSGKPSIETHRLWWAICDGCGEGIWTSRLAKTKTDPIAGLSCCMTWLCKGKHRKPEVPT